MPVLQFAVTSVGLISFNLVHQMSFQERLCEILSNFYFVQAVVSFYFVLVLILYLIELYRGCLDKAHWPLSPSLSSVCSKETTHEKLIFICINIIHLHQCACIFISIIQCVVIQVCLPFVSFSFLLFTLYFLSLIN